MSLAGTRSNRGDYYQKLIAFDWILTLLTDADYEWIEVDSIQHEVDDIVIAKSDGSLICCQCKKNQRHFKAWSLADLKEELEKAVKELAASPNTTLIFYSRGAFGDIAKLKEFSTNYENESQLSENLTKGHQDAHKALQDIGAAKITPFELLQRTTFESSNDFDRIEMLQLERLERLVSNAKQAYESIWLVLDKLGGRIAGNRVGATKHRLTRNDLLEILNQSGSLLVPLISEQEVRSSFVQTSAIGRSWKTDISGKYLPNPILDEIMDGIESKLRSILVTGQPGSGKTCLMLELQNILEEKASRQNNLTSLFIQSREFSEASNTEERQHQGLSKQWVEQAARLAESCHVVVIIDSLDVLSISREHNVLSYFLAQIDRLQNIPNVTVITACRDFDRQYDRRISEKEWDKELTIPSLSWDEQVQPFLVGLDIDTADIDPTTQILITNPRELDLYVELAKRSGSFNVVSSQTLAQKYLATLVSDDPSLGTEAIIAIENAARRMLESRALSIPYQLFDGEETILRRLLSLGLLQKTHDDGLTFGHQTLLDVLVISNAVRTGVSLKDFIGGLPPVPFVRPSIRSFVNQLASGERRIFRKQLRVVLTGQFPFHIRRLVAETYAQQPVDPSDWALLRDLRNHHREVFQVIYTQCQHISWFHLWQQNLLSELKHSRDQEGYESYLYRISRWLNEDTEMVISVWTGALDCQWIKIDNLSRQISFYLRALDTEKLYIVKPLVLKLLKNLNSDGDFHGETIALCVESGVLTDRDLWKYITHAVKAEHIYKYRLDNKLNCRPHQFGNKNEDFLKIRMSKSPDLLDLAIKTINDWSGIFEEGNSCSNKRHTTHFLYDTSYDNKHSQGMSAYDDINLLFDAIEHGIKNNAECDSQWWKENRFKLSESNDLALIYFLALAASVHPKDNVDVIQKIILDEKILKSSISFEVGELINQSAIYLDVEVLTGLSQLISSLYEDEIYSDGNVAWISKEKVSYISSIPCHLRTDESQRVIDTYETINGSYIREPEVSSRGGFVRAPFSYELILEISDAALLKLLAHYTGHSGRFDDFLVGGEESVAQELRGAASRQPERFANYLIENWNLLATSFRNAILDGLTDHLRYLYGHLKPNQDWTAIEQPDKYWLSEQVLYELERHPIHWCLTMTKANALEACAHVINNNSGLIDRLVFQMFEFAYLFEEKLNSNDARLGLIHDGINMRSGKVADAAMVLATNITESGSENSDFIISLLKLFFYSDTPAVKAVLLRRLLYLKNNVPKLAWELFDKSVTNDDLWPYAESFLYYSYHDEFEKVEPFLARIKKSNDSESMATLGRLSALSGLSGFISIDHLTKELIEIHSNDAWKGALDVWSHRENFDSHHEICTKGLDAAFNQTDNVKILAGNAFAGLLGDHKPAFYFTESIFNRFIDSLGLMQNQDNNNRNHFQEINEWLSLIVQSDPIKAMTLAETYIMKLQDWKPHLYDHNRNLAQLMNHLFIYAEEIEEMDDGEMLGRAVDLQDALLSVAGSEVQDWLRAAERP
jgi:Cdc6-like AAA superfamily ATPase